MQQLVKWIRYFSWMEYALWGMSVRLIVVSSMLFSADTGMTCAASLLGVTSLIFNAKANPIGQVLMLFFSVFYGYISYTFSYYGEMLTYLGMTAPMSIAALVSWLRNPFDGNHAQVRMQQLTERQVRRILWQTALVTAVFTPILAALGTANMIPSSISIATSYLAVALTYDRSPYFALAYAANDIVLIVLWGMAAATQSSYLAVCVCFAVFLLNDVYTAINWRRIYHRQRAQTVS